jgi:hypothetical protein
MCCDHHVGLRFYSKLAQCKTRCTGLLNGFDFHIGKKVPRKPGKTLPKKNEKKSKKTDKYKKKKIGLKGSKKSKSKTTKTAKTAKTTKITKIIKPATKKP